MTHWITSGRCRVGRGSSCRRFTPTPSPVAVVMTPRSDCVRHRGLNGDEGRLLPAGECRCGGGGCVFRGLQGFAPLGSSRVGWEGAGLFLITLKALRFFFGWVMRSCGLLGYTLAERRNAYRVGYKRDKSVRPRLQPSRAGCVLRSLRTFKMIVSSKHVPRGLRPSARVESLSLAHTEPRVSHPGYEAYAAQTWKTFFARGAY
jgi:hypothetical protein